MFIYMSSVYTFRGSSEIAAEALDDDEDKTIGDVGIAALDVDKDVVVAAAAAAAAAAEVRILIPPCCWLLLLSFSFFVDFFPPPPPLPPGCCELCFAAGVFFSLFSLFCCC